MVFCIFLALRPYNYVLRNTARLNVSQALTEEFADITGTDQALAQFFLQDRNWDLEVCHAFRCFAFCHHRYCSLQSIINALALVIYLSLNAGNLKIFRYISDVVKYRYRQVSAAVSGIGTFI